MTLLLGELVAGSRTIATIIAVVLVVGGVASIFGRKLLAGQTTSLGEGLPPKARQVILGSADLKRANSGWQVQYVISGVVLIAMGITVLVGVW